MTERTWEIGYTQTFSAQTGLMVDELIEKKWGLNVQWKNLSLTSNYPYIQLIRQWEIFPVLWCNFIYLLGCLSLHQASEKYCKNVSILSADKKKKFYNKNSLHSCKWPTQWISELHNELSTKLIKDLDILCELTLYYF